MGPGPGRCVGDALQCTGVGGITLHPIMLRGVSEAPLTWSNPGKGNSCWRCPPQSHSAGGAWLQDEPRKGTQAAHGALRGCSTAFVALLERGSVARDRGQCHTPGFRVVHGPLQPCGKAPSREEAELPLSTERGPAAALHPDQHLRPARWPLQLHAPPPSPTTALGAGTAPSSPRLHWQPESQNCTRHVLAARHVE